MNDKHATLVKTSNYFQRLFKIVIIYFVFQSCNPLSGHRGISDNIEDSKDRGVFVSTCASERNPFIINDTLKLLVKEAWIEREWYYPRLFKKPTIGTGYNLIIITDDLSLKEYDISWAIGITGKNAFSVNKDFHFIHCYFDELPADKVTFPVQMGNILPAIPQKIVDTLIINQVKN